MANLTDIPLQADVAENTGEFTVLPAGKYKACIVADELKDNKNQNGKILVLKIQVTDGQFAREILTDHINITNPSAQCQAIGQGTLKRICNICGVPYPPQDTNGLMGKPFVVDVKVEEFTSNNTGNKLKSNKIKGYHSADTPTSMAPAQTAAQSHGQDVQPQQQAASGW
jgi:hypothetical protein